jgi:hypothetical protein
MAGTRCTIEISFEAPERYSEASFDDVTTTEVMLEGGVSPLLMELFGGTILMENVTIRYTPLHEEKHKDYSFGQLY